MKATSREQLPWNGRADSKANQTSGPARAGAAQCFVGGGGGKRREAMMAGRTTWGFGRGVGFENPRFRKRRGSKLETPQGDLKHSNGTGLSARDAARPVRRGRARAGPAKPGKARLSQRAGSAPDGAGPERGGPSESPEAEAIAAIANSASSSRRQPRLARSRAEGRVERLGGPGPTRSSRDAPARISAAPPPGCVCVCVCVCV